MPNLNVIEKAVKDLGMVKVPTELILDISVPIFNIRQNLIKYYQEAQAEEAAQNEEPEVVEEPESAEPDSEE